jgi:hypothetical protein
LNHISKKEERRVREDRLKLFLFLGGISAFFTLISNTNIQQALAIPKPPPPPVRFGIVDQLWGSPETGFGTDDDFLSGSVKRIGGKDVNVPIAPKQEKPASHVVFSDPLAVPLPYYSPLGKKWVLGKDQPVPGGFGPLSVLFGGLEPTGRKVVELGLDNEAEFKLILVQNDPGSGVGVYMPFFRACLRNPVTKKWSTCSPFDIPSGISIAIPEKSKMPIDITKPYWNNIKPSAAVKAQIKQVLSPKNLQRLGIQTAAQAGSSLAGQTLSSGGSKGKGTSQQQTRAVQRPTRKLVRGGQTRSAIAQATARFWGVSSASGPDGGNQACAWMVNKVVYAATGKTLGANPDYVPSVEADLASGSGYRVSQSNANAGDIVIAKGQAHIGICLNTGCTRVLSNSSSRARFVWESDINFGGYYDSYGGSSVIYRVK